jgi:predicted DNA-binding transcriptional regulator YafY
MPNSATRLITLLMLLQRNPNQKAADLAHSLGVSVRSLHRYMAMLEGMGIPLYTERGRNGGFSLVRGYKMPPLVFSPEEAAALFLGTSLVSELWGRLYQDAAQGALAKLENVLPDEQRQEAAWARRTLAATGLHRVGLDAQLPVLEDLRSAIHEQHRVSLLYHAMGKAEPARRKVDPYALVHRQGWWYVVGYCHLRQALRSFRIDRIRQLAVLAETFDPPADFDIQAYLAAEPRPPTQVQVRLKFFAEGALVAHSLAVMWSELEPQADGSVAVSMATPDLEYAAQFVMSFGPLVVVLDPDELRQMVIERAGAMIARYKGEKNGKD